MDLSRQGIADAQPPFSLNPTREELCLPIKRYEVLDTGDEFSVDGTFVFYEDHIKVVRELEDRLERMRLRMVGMQLELDRASAAESELNWIKNPDRMGT